jgi:hypothetical protein
LLSKFLGGTGGESEGGLDEVVVVAGMEKIWWWWRRRRRRQQLPTNGARTAAN